MNEASPDAAAPAPPPAPTAGATPRGGTVHADGETCPNCGAATWGEFCFACGQPRKGLIRRFTSIMGDFLDTVFSIDNRLLRTIGPLYFKPGHLTCEYIAGRRVRYVTPFRLFFFLCVLSFLSLKFLASQTPGAINFGDSAETRIAMAKSVAEVDERLAEAVKGLEAGRSGARIGMSAGGVAKVAIEAADERFAEALADLKEEADQRKRWLAEVDKARAEGRTPPPDPNLDEEEGTINFGDGPWDPVKNPIAIAWLPDAVNAGLNERAGRVKDAFSHARENPQPLIEAFFGAIPPAAFVLMPLFALFLKFMYLFKRRLYMEHLLTALHSHAFIFLSLLLISLCLLAQQFLGPRIPALDGAIDWLVFAMGWWMPLYLLIAQKRIYRQGWIATVFKFGVIGIAYTVLLGIGLMLAVVFGLFSL
jgi:hypothetical protein